MNVPSAQPLPKRLHQFIPQENTFHVVYSSMFLYLLGMMAPGNIPLPGTIPPYAGSVRSAVKLCLQRRTLREILGGGGRRNFQHVYAFGVCHCFKIRIQAFKIRIQAFKYEFKLLKYEFSFQNTNSSFQIMFMYI